jgi:hypothetical protein
MECEQEIEIQRHPPRSGRNAPSPRGTAAHDEAVVSDVKLVGTADHLQHDTHVFRNLSDIARIV